MHRVLALSPESFSQCLHWNRLSSPKFLSFGVICLGFYTLGALDPIPRGGQPPPGTEVGVGKGIWGFSPLPPRSGRELEVNPGGFGWGIPLALEPLWLSHTIGGVSGEAEGTGARLGPGSEQDLVAGGGWLGEFGSSGAVRASPHPAAFRVVPYGPH